MRIKKMNSLTTNLLTLPPEISYHIGYHLAKNPKDLAIFGKTCRLTHEITNDIFKNHKTLFDPITALYKEEFSTKNRLLDLLRNLLYLKKWMIFSAF